MKTLRAVLFLTILTFFTSCRKDANNGVVQYNIHLSYLVYSQTFNITPAKELTQKTGWDEYFFATPKEDIIITSTVNEKDKNLFRDMTKNYMVVTRMNVGDNSIITRDTIRYNGWQATYKYKH